ncbi:MAG: MoaD/ThiS family protein [Chloroflexi bacterium]|nr:MoaD/ThiS family protein [Chloroflexota bacterium]
MSVRVRIPEPLRRATQGEGTVEVQAGTIAECIDRLEAKYPGMRERLVGDSGELRHFVNVYVNGEDVRFLQGLTTPLNVGDEVSIVPAVAGG